MRIELTTPLGRFSARLDHPVDLSVGVRFDGTGPSAFDLPPAQQTPFSVPGFVADTAAGAACNVARITLHPHGDGTHTESARHVDHTAPGVDSVRPRAPLLAWLATTRATETGPADRVIGASALASALLDARGLGATALLLRTGPRSERGAVRWSGTNPPYLSAQALAAIREAGIEHLLIDLPSVDRESDGGAMAAHRAFFAGREHVATITEMIAVPDDLADGPLLLWLATPNIATDAVPCSPVVFSLVPLP